MISNTLSFDEFMSPEIPRFYFEDTIILNSGVSAITYFNLMPVRHMTQ